MVIKNTTVLSGEEVKKSLIKITKKNYYKRFIIVGILAIFGTLILMLSMNNDALSNPFTTGFLFLGFAMVFAIYNCISLAFISRKVVRKNGIVTTAGMTNNFTFKEESFQLIVKINSSSSKIEMPYSNLKKIINLEDRILFMLSASDIFIAKKDGFSSSKEVDIFFYGLQKHKIKVKNKINKDK